MISTLLLGIAIGAAIASGATFVIWFLLLRKAQAAVTKERAEFDKRQLDLLEERTRLERQVSEHLKVLAEWCQENWKR